MPIDNETANRSYPLPSGENPLDYDVLKLIAAMVAIDVDMQAALSAASGYAPLASPAFSGVPTAPTPTTGANTTQLATTAFVQAAIALVEASVAGGMFFKGNWDASAGTFPGAGSAQTGWYYIVSVAGTVDGVEFAVNDAVIAKSDDASTSSYAGNWVKRDATDAVQSVAGLTGAVSAASLRAALAMAIADISGLQAALDGKSNTGHLHTGVYEPFRAAASQAEMEAGTESAVRSMSPLRVAQAIVALSPSLIGAYVSFDGSGTPSIGASSNVSSITDNGTGDYTINFTTPFADTNYVVIGLTGANEFRHLSILTKATGSVRVINSGVNVNRGDASVVDVAVIGGS